MKAILIDPANKLVQEISIDGRFGIARLLGEPPSNLSALRDTEVVYSVKDHATNAPTFRLAGKKSTIAGKAIVIGCDTEGLCSTMLTADFLRPGVIFQ